MIDDRDRAPGSGGAEAPKGKWSWGEKPPQLYVLCALAVLCVPVFMFAPQQAAASLLIFGGLALLTNPVSGLGPIRRQRYLLPLAGMLAWGALSTLWAIEDAETLKRVWRLAAFSVFGILIVTYARELRDKDKALLGRVLAAAVWVIIVLFLFERLTDKSLTALVTETTAYERHAILNRPGTLLLLLAWPAAGMLFSAKRPYQALAMLMAAGLVQVGAQGQASILAWIAGGVAASLAAVLPRVTAVVLTLAVAGAVFAGPVLVNQPSVLQALAVRTPDTAVSMRHRLLIWSFTGERIADRPFLGWGLDAARVIPGAQATALSYADRIGAGWVRPQDRDNMAETAILPLHTHNAVLQIWLELGIVGAAILSVFVGMIAAAASKGPPAARATRFGLLAAAFTIACVSYGAWQSWWVAALFITGAFAAALPDRVREK